MRVMRAKPFRAREKRLPAVLLLLGVCGEIAFAGITGSSHDLSARGWGTTEICVFCHTPHNAKAEQLTPLWNHQSTAASYILYSSPTMGQAPVQPRDGSKVCLSCHDGTIAVDAYGARTGASLMTGPANLGTDLSNDHPVSVYWNHQTGPQACSSCHSLHPSTYVGLPFFNRYLECATCHEPHNRFPAYTKMLRKPLSGSALCLQCHGK
jgi:predicted CXXCH cytochrome family protein